MGLVIPLSLTLDSHVLAQSLTAAPRRRTLRDAAPDVISTIHGLPAAMDAELSQLEVYVGRAGATPYLLRNRWVARFEAFDRAPSSFAVVAVRAPTDLVRRQQWERTAQLLVNALTKNRALCCANALTGETGRWPDTDECAIYVVAHKRRGPAGQGTNAMALNAAVSDLLHEDSLDASVVRAAAREILVPDRGIEHEVYEHTVESLYEEYPKEEKVCRAEGCQNRAYSRNYGFCRIHRPYVDSSGRACKSCGRPARPGNYGFCGRHRR